MAANETSPLLGVQSSVNSITGGAATIDVKSITGGAANGVANVVTSRVLDGVSGQLSGRKRQTTKSTKRLPQIKGGQPADPGAFDGKVELCVEEQPRATADAGTTARLAFQPPQHVPENRSVVDTHLAEGAGGVGRELIEGEDAVASVAAPADAAVQPSLTAPAGGADPSHGLRCPSRSREQIVPSNSSLPGTVTASTFTGYSSDKDSEAESNWATQCAAKLTKINERAVELHLKAVVERTVAFDVTKPDSKRFDRFLGPDEEVLSCFKAHGFFQIDGLVPPPSLTGFLDPGRAVIALTGTRSGKVRCLQRTSVACC